MCRRSRLVGLVVGLALVAAAACSPGRDGAGDDRAAPRPSTSTAPDAPAPTTEPTTTTTSVEQVAPVRPAPPVPASTAPVACPAVPARATPAPARPSYAWHVRVDLAAGAVEGRGVMAFTPDADVDRVVVRLWANSPRIARGGGRMEVFPDGELGADQPDPTTLVLRRAVRAGERFETGLVWRLTLPTSPTDDRVHRSGDALRLGAFLPVIAWEPGVGWAEQPPTSGFAEASVSVPADYRVAVTGLPDGVSVLATGVQRDGEWFAAAVPDWAMSAGRFTTATADVGGVAVAVGVDAQVGEPPGPYLDKVVRSIERFSALYGPYPWPSYSLAVTPRLPGGIESPMHVMQGPRTIGRTTSHEVAHMWFYGLLGSHQGRDPWIDEGLATWAEGRFEGTTASLLSRTIPEGGRGRAGEPMTYWESRQSIYYRSVYVQGAQVVGALGPPEAVDCALRHLVARHAFRVVRPADVVATMASIFPDAPAVMARYGVRG